VRSAAVLCLLAIAATGCGAAPKDSTKKFKGEQQKVAAVVEQLETAARDDKPQVVCGELLSDALLKRIKNAGTNCRTGAKEAFADADSFDLTVTDVKIAGDKATATVISGTGSKKKTDALELERVGAVWKIAALRQ
jgi:hypothetical protein